MTRLCPYRFKEFADAKQQECIGEECKLWWRCDGESRLVELKGILDATREANESLRAKNDELQSLLLETGVELSGIVGKLNMGNAKLALVDQDGEVVS